MAPAPLDLARVLATHPLLPLAWRTAGLAARFLSEERPERLEVETKSSESDSVTVMDRTAERIVVDEILGVRPDDSFLGEEGGAHSGGSHVRWIIDPLDGTVNYLYRMPAWGVSLAAEEAGIVTVGVVVMPELGDAYIGVRGVGSWLVRGASADRLAPSDCTSLSAALVSTGFGYAADRRRAQGAVLAGLIGQVRDVRRIGAAVVDLCWVARGRLDAHVEAGLHPWDYAAAALIATEAGARVEISPGSGTEAFVVAAAPGVAGELLAALQELNAADIP